MFTIGAFKIIHKDELTHDEFNMLVAKVLNAVKNFGQHSEVKIVFYNERS